MMNRFFKRILISTVCLTFVFQLSAQRQRRHTVVLNDGSRFTGTVISDTSGYVRVRIKSPRVIVLPRSSVASVDGNHLFFRETDVGRGYYMQISASNLTGSSEPGSTNGVSINFSNGYQFRNGLSIGVGTGLEDFEGAMVPVFSVLKYQPFKRRVSPYIWVKTGYSFATPDMARGGEYWGSVTEQSGGIIANAGVGVELYSWNRNSISFGIGYRYQKATISNIYRFGTLTTRYDWVTEYNRIEMQLGFVFR
jgi:hypothetical protein